MTLTDTNVRITATKNGKTVVVDVECNAQGYRVMRDGNQIWQGSKSFVEDFVNERFAGAELRIEQI